MPLSFYTRTTTLSRTDGFELHFTRCQLNYPLRTLPGILGICNTATVSTLGHAMPLVSIIGATSGISIPTEIVTEKCKLRIHSLPSATDYPLPGHIHLHIHLHIRVYVHHMICSRGAEIAL